MDKYELPEFERRFFSRSNEGLEIRAAGDGDLPKIVTLERTNSDTVIAGLFVERIERGAFSRAIREGHDVRALFNHDPNQVLARTKNKTLTLRETEEGLESEADPADTS